ncbi:PREDICTED: non-specific lipid-transfer protein 4-like [Tarenaya hassleriana]|uniref:non-specific lipid-transfer protein 4-like n=1 Tax=Tarenaya hassleriana TaxID=28532 RepID=UPI00053C66E4|nr:PREDICTED: non-specific lipid-transfer protein 4-like [Tarenaya hassleriana]
MALAARRWMACMVMVALAAAAFTDAAITCGTVQSKLAPCIMYVTGGGGTVPPPCCAGIKDLYGMAGTTPDRRQACLCLQSAAKGITGIKPDLAASLPRACGVSLPYPISGSINCNSIN